MEAHGWARGAGWTRCRRRSGGVGWGKLQVRGVRRTADSVDPAYPDASGAIRTVKEDAMSTTPGPTDPKDTDTSAEPDEATSPAAESAAAESAETETATAEPAETEPAETETEEGTADAQATPATAPTPSESATPSQETAEADDEDAEDSDDEDDDDDSDNEDDDEEKQRAAEEFAAAHDPAKHDVAAGEDFRQPGDWTADDAGGPQVWDSEGNLVSEGGEGGEGGDAGDAGDTSDDSGDESGEPAPAAGGGRRVSDLEEVKDGGYSVGSAAPLHDGAMPVGHPVKAWEDTKTYVTEDQEHYDEAVPHVWFTDADTAERAGFRPAD